MKGGKREGAGRKPSATPHTARVTIRLTPEQAAQLKALGGAVWLRKQIHLIINQSKQNDYKRV